MLLTCKCLNISITINEPGIKSIDFLQLGFSEDDLRDDFFKNGAGTVELVEISKEQPSLVHIRSLGDWLLHRCLVCDGLTHAIHRERRPAEVIVTFGLLNDEEKIKSIKSSDAYSEVFRVVTNRHDDIVPTSPIKGSGAAHVGALALQQTLAEAIRARTTQVEERVRAFTEQQFADLEQFRATAHEDHQALLRILQRHAQLLSELPHAPVIDKGPKPGGTVGAKAAANIPMGLPPIPHPLPTARAVAPKSAPARSRRPFSAAAANHHQQLPRGRNHPGLLGPQVSLDSEGLFDLEGMEEGAAPEEHSHSGEETEEDTDESGSHDEGIHIPRSRGGGGGQGHALHLAKSLPVNVPAFHLATADDLSGDPFAPERNQLAAEIQREHDRMDIAASIKALAQSVRGGASVFGDLPRPPRFSTQL